MLSRLLSRLVWLAIVRRVVWYFQDDLGTHTRSNAPPHLRPRRCRRPRLATTAIAITALAITALATTALAITALAKGDPERSVPVA